MQLLAALPPFHLSRLHLAASKWCAVRSVASLAAAAQVIRGSRVDALVLDPLLDQPTDPGPCIRLQSSFASTPMLIYATFVPDMPRAVMRLVRPGFDQMILAGINDSPEDLQLALQEAQSASLLHRIRETIGRSLEPTPPDLRVDIDAIIAESLTVSRVSQLPNLICGSLRTLERRFRRAGLPAPKRLTAAARLLYAYFLLRDRGRTISDVACVLGYSDARALQLACRNSVGMTVGRMRRAPLRQMEDLVACRLTVWGSASARASSGEAVAL